MHVCTVVLMRSARIDSVSRWLFFPGMDRNSGSYGITRGVAGAFNADDGVFRVKRGGGGREGVS